MHHQATVTGQNLRKLAIIFSGCSVLLVLLDSVMATATLSSAGFWWIQVAYYTISSVTVTIAIAMAVVAWRYHNNGNHLVRMLATAGFTTALGQLILGIVIPAGPQRDPLADGIYLLAAMLTLGLAVTLTTIVYLPSARSNRVGLSNPIHRFYVRSIVLSILGFLLLLISGTMVTGAQTGLACADWPLCQGEIFPALFSLEIAISLLHRFSAVFAGVLAAAVILQTHRRYAGYKPLVTWSKLFGLLLLVQIGIGGLYTLVDIPQGAISFIHLGLSIAIWGNLIVLAIISYCTLETAVSIPMDAEPDPGQRSVRQKAVTFFKLTKPWILVLLLITTITAMVIAAKGLPPVSLLLYTLLGGFLSAGGASVLNSYVDSDIDRLMSRTSRRATVTGLVTPQETLLFGLILSTLSFLIFAIFVNLLSAILSTIGILYYVFFYTLYLKRTTIHNIIIGGAAGAIPPLVGWTAVADSLDLSAFYLFAIIFFWTPPHTWALALMVKKDYAQAHVPMLPVVAGEKETTYQIFLYSILLITLTILPVTINMVSWVYVAVALTLGGRFIYLAWKLWRNYEKSVSRKLYKFSQAYLALLFLMMAIDRSLF